MNFIKRKKLLVSIFKHALSSNDVGEAFFDSVSRIPIVESVHGDVDLNLLRFGVNIFESEILHFHSDSVWNSKDGPILVRNMETRHLFNCVAMLFRYSCACSGYSVPDKPSKSVYLEYVNHIDEDDYLSHIVNMVCVIVGIRKVSWDSCSVGDFIASDLSNVKDMTGFDNDDSLKPNKKVRFKKPKQALRNFDF